MSHYLLSVHGGGADREPPSPADMQTMMERIVALESEMEAAGAFVFGGRLHGPDAATLVADHDGEVVTTDGPYLETKEHLAGFYLIDAGDLDEALAWAAKVTRAIGAPIEVRPFAATGKAADQLPQGSAG